MFIQKVTISIVLFALFCEYAYAVPPPDFIIQAASQLVSFFTIWIILLSGIYATGIQFLRAYYTEHKNLVLILWIPSILLIAWIWAYYANNYYEWIKQAEYNKSWIEESRKSKQNSPIWKQTQNTTPQSISWEINTNSWLSYSSWDTFIANVAWWESINNDWIFFEKNKNSNIKITNNELKKIIEWNNQEYIILDAREDLEYENGHIPDSTHIRFAVCLVNFSQRSMMMLAKTKSCSTPNQTRPSCSQAIKSLPLPPKPEKTTWPGAVHRFSGFSFKLTGFWVGCK